MSTTTISPAPTRPAGPPTAPLAPGGFPADELRGPRSARQRVLLWLTDTPRRFRLGVPLLRLMLRRQGVVLVTGYDAVKDVLADNRAFPVPFGERFEEMDRAGTNFILGMPEDDGYKAIHAAVMRALLSSRDDLSRVACFAGRRAEDLVEKAARRGKIDAMAGLLTRVPAEVVGDYYGIPILDEQFPLWTMAMSAYAFAGPVSDERTRRAALDGAERLGKIVDAAVAKALSGAPDDGTVLGRLVASRRRLPGVTFLTNDVLRATMVGLITGFVPTCAKASGQILEMLLRRPDMLAAAEAAARAGDDDLLRRCLFEALRFKQTLPGIFRHCDEGRVLPGGQRVRRGEWVWAAAQLAAFDPERVEKPWRFDPARGDADSLGFGFGQHRCVGAALAETLITATFKPLLLLGGLRRVPGEDGRPTAFATFTEHHLVAFGTGAAP